MCVCVYMSVIVLFCPQWNKWAKLPKFTPQSEVTLDGFAYLNCVCPHRLLLNQSMNIKRMMSYNRYKPAAWKWTLYIGIDMSNQNCPTFPYSILTK